MVVFQYQGGSTSLVFVSTLRCSKHWKFLSPPWVDDFGLTTALWQCDGKHRNALNLFYYKAANHFYSCSLNAKILQITETITGHIL